MKNSILKLNLKEESLLIDCDSVNKILFETEIKTKKKSKNRNNDLLYDTIQKELNFDDTETCLSFDSLFENDDLFTLSNKKNDLKKKLENFKNLSNDNIKKNYELKRRFANICLFIEDILQEPLLLKRDSCCSN